jgi:GNAT superfamily N-acetyltransferase
VSDYRGIVDLQVEPDDDPIPELERWEREQMPGTLVCERGDLVGFVSSYDTATHGYIRYLSVHRDARRGGIATALMTAVAAGFRSRGLSEWQLHVRTENAAARALYERLGMQHHEQLTLVRLAWNRVTSLPIAEHALSSSEVADEGELLRALAISPEQLAKLRPGRMFVRLRDDSGDIGIAGFVPGSAAVRPLRIARPELVFELLRALAPYARADRDWFLVGFHDDESLVPQLQSIGGEIRSRTYRYAGAL